jgi:hypothetical protein
VQNESGEFKENCFLTGVNINTENNQNKIQKQENRETEEKIMVVKEPENKIVKENKHKRKAEPLENNYFTLFSDNEKMIHGQMAAIKNKINNFSILSNSRLRAFKFDHIIKTNFGYFASSQEDGPKDDPFEAYVNLEAERFLFKNKNLIYANMVENSNESVPIKIPEFPKAFYNKWVKVQQKKNDEEKEDEDRKPFDIKVSFLVIRDNERIDLIIEYFNEKLKKMNKNQLQSSHNEYIGTYSEGNVQHENFEMSSSQIEDTQDALNAQKAASSGIEKDFVFNFRTFKEVFPYISSVRISDHSSIEEAYHEWMLRFFSKSKKPSPLSNILVIQFYKTSYSSLDSEDMLKQKQWSNFFTYVHLPFGERSPWADLGTIAEIVGRAMKKKSETKIFDCLFRKSPLLMRLQDFLFPAYPSQKDFLATQTKMQVTLNPFWDLSRVSNFLTHLQFFKTRLKNEVLNEEKAAQLLAKYFKDDFSKIKTVLKDYSMAGELMNMKQSKKYATPGYEEINLKSYSYLIKLLSYWNKNPQHPQTVQIGYNTMSTEGGNKNFTMSRYREQASLDKGNYYTNYTFLRDDKIKSGSKRSVASVGFNVHRNPISLLNKAGKINIETRIHLDNLKKQLSNKFEKEMAFSINWGNAGDVRAQLLNHRERFAGNMTAKSKRRFNHPNSALHNRRGTANQRATHLMRLNKDDYHSAQNQRNKYPSSLGHHLASNKSGPLHQPRKFRKSRKDKVSYEYFLSIASQSIAKNKRDIASPYMSQPETVVKYDNTDLDDNQSNQLNKDEMKDSELEEKMLTYKNNMEHEDIGSIVNHMEKERERNLSEQEEPRVLSQQKHSIVSKRHGKYGVQNDDKYSKYTSLRQEKGLSTKPISTDGKCSNRSNLQKHRNRMVMNNGEKIKNIYKMVPSKPIMTSVLRNR